VNKGKRKGRTTKEPDPRLTSHYLRSDRRTVVKGASQPSWVFLSAYRSFFHASCAPVLNHPTMGLIHRSAWKENSANFAMTEFSEGRLIPFNTNIAHLGYACPRLGV
jgi:hypothetical protein